METVLLLLVALSPWAFGSADPVYEAYLDGGVAVLLVLWGARMLLEGQLRWKKCPVALCLAALILLGVGQLLPLPRDLLGRLSPATARLYDRLLPGQGEVLPAGEGRTDQVPTPGTTISLYPHGTRGELARFLAIFLVFVLVRNALDPVGGLRRLSLVALLNGMLLALFGLIQFFTSSPGTIFWNVQVQSGSFGPFVNRDHLAFYLNLCLGLGVGLLLAVVARKGHEEGHAQAPRGSRRQASWSTSETGLLDWLQQPKVLWISLALVILVAGLAFSLSRGGFLALFAGLVVCLTLHSRRSTQFWRLESGLLIVALTLGLVAWLGLDQVEARLGTLWTGEALHEDRLALYERCWTAVKAFPLWGTGYGTFPYVEQMYHESPINAGLSYHHAHNDYLEALVEGGAARLLLTVLAIGLVFRLGYRAYRRHEGRSAGGLALGALFGFTTVVVHSGVDFGLHTPAVALLAAVLCAYLMGLSEEGRGAGSRSASRAAAGSDAYVLRLWGLAPLVGAATVVCLGLFLYENGRRASKAWQFRRAAAFLENTTHREDLTQRLIYLKAAVAWQPTDAELQERLADAYQHYVDEKKWELTTAARRASAAQAIGTLSPINSLATPQASWTHLAAWWLAAQVRETEVLEEATPLLRQERFSGLRHYLQARDLCPLLARAQLGLAANADWLEQADPYGVYLERAQLADPGSPDTWYNSGVEESHHDQRQQACACWRRSLDLSSQYLDRILDRSVDLLSPQEILQQVLPDRPSLLVAAAQHLYPQPDQTEERQPFLARALFLVEHLTPPLSPEELHLKATLQATLDQPGQAVATYREALAEKPEQTLWRYELARLLYQRGQFQQARMEVLTVLDEEPNLAEARSLLDQVQEALARGK